MNNEIIPIIFSSNDFYVPYTSVMIQSILDNSNNLRLYKIYILHKDITEESSLLLRQQVERFTNFSLEFVNVSVFFEKLNLFIPEKLTIETYFRLVIPYLLNEYDKVLFFDGDMICRVDVATLYDLDLQDNFIAAVRDIGLSQYYGKHHNYKLYKIMYELRFPERYFNGGLLLWNIKKFRDFITKQELFDLLGSRIWPICDQDMLNFLCNERVLLLSYRWNFMSQNINALPVDLQNDYQKSSENPNIIHFKPFKKWFFILCIVYLK
jgi:lipopolysaccharide biosynthesis glycosyltransferase